MFGCWFGRHEEPIRRRLNESTILWVCPRCDREVGRSEYPPGDVFIRRQQVAKVVHLQAEFLKKQLMRRLKREKSA